MSSLENRIRERLDEVIDPCSAANGTNLSIIDMGLLDEIDVDEGHVTVSMRLTTPFCMQLPYFVEEIDDRIGAIDEVTSVRLETDEGVDWHTGMMSEEAQKQRRERKAAREAEYFDETAEDVQADD
ncbi:metal-sulfur cluster assembly factor [Natrinema salsiterrestre]|uniref:Iron-sulfur cluster assembly protein n=1 Tax=Natrinema salsiterrestre TaxID=2950540 RepID=A0A9Q4Q3Q7_9EURY|nr:iron-sulfur cluster assembly protein [Natrinema salsiterrestre]MDF9747811.1 iron-sulfur cluster assembly protein [Natrinema salsiterrestre]